MDTGQIEMIPTATAVRGPETHMPAEHIELRWYAVYTCANHEKRVAQPVSDGRGAEPLDRADEGARVRRCRKVVYAVVAIAGDIASLCQFPTLGTAIRDCERSKKPIRRALEHFEKRCSNCWHADRVKFCRVR